MNTDYISKPIIETIFLKSFHIMGDFRFRFWKRSVFRRGRPFVLSKIIMKPNYYDYMIEDPIDPFLNVLFILFILFLMWLAHEEDKDK